nr:head-tail adaptor protein [Rhodospirillales bacterium]
MKAGLLRHRLKIQERKKGKDNNLGLQYDDFITFCEVWGNVQVITGRERWANEHVAHDYSVAVTIRYRADIKSEMRILFGHRILEIKSIIDPTGRGRELRLLCLDFDS